MSSALTLGVGTVGVLLLIGLATRLRDRRTDSSRLGPTERQIREFHGGRKPRALIRALGAEGGAAVTAGAGVVAVGGLFMGVGFVEVSITKTPAFNNPWLAVGLGVALFGLAIMLAAFFAIVRRYYRTEWIQYRIASAAHRGQDILKGLTSGPAATQQEIHAWFSETNAFLNETDPAGTMSVRFNNDSGIEPPFPAGGLAAGADMPTYCFVYRRTSRLAEFLERPHAL